MYKIIVKKSLLLDDKTFNEGEKIAFNLDNEGNMLRIIGTIQVIDEKEEQIVINEIICNGEDMYGIMRVNLSDIKNPKIFIDCD